jgi:UDPglucose--hexose-1-phosphate uridylyltransferase
MPELRKDPLLGRWVIVAPERADRPHAFLKPRDDSDTSTCPFCPGNEGLTTGEIYALREPGSQHNGPGWSLRVIPNRFPALRIEVSPQRRGEGLFDLLGGTGAHEVIIESPDHRTALSKLPVRQVADVLRAWQARMHDLSRDLRLQAAQVFRNFGVVSGATLFHPHSQLIALPLVPWELEQELAASAEHYQRKRRCPFCDLLAQELEAQKRVVLQTEQAVVLAPYASRSPFELHLYPRQHRAGFEHAPPEEIEGLAEALRTTLRKLDVALEGPAFNLFLMTAPLRYPAETAHYHYRLVVKPTLTQPGGFEWSTGCFINPTPPEEAARFLQQTEVK